MTTYTHPISGETYSDWDELSSVVHWQGQQDLLEERAKLGTDSFKALRAGLRLTLQHPSQLHALMTKTYQEYLARGHADTVHVGSVNPHPALALKFLKISQVALHGEWTDPRGPMLKLTVEVVLDRVPHALDLPQDDPLGRKGLQPGHLFDGFEAVSTGLVVGQPGCFVQDIQAPVSRLPLLQAKLLKHHMLSEANRDHARQAEKLVAERLAADELSQAYAREVQAAEDAIQDARHRRARALGALAERKQEVTIATCASLRFSEEVALTELAQAFQMVTFKKAA